MSAQLVCENEILTVFLSGEIDHHTSKEIREQTDKVILETHPKEIILNFKDVSFMDSSGIGLIMGRYKLSSSYGAKITVADTSMYLKRVMRLAGIDTLVNMQDQAKKEETKNEG